MTVTSPIRHTAFRELAPSVHWAQLHQRTPQFKWARRIYDFQFLYVIQGELRATLMGTTIPVPAGHLLFLPAGIFHSIEVLSAPHAHLLGIHFDFFSDLRLKQNDIVVDESNLHPDCFCAMPYVDGTALFPEHYAVMLPPSIVSLMEATIHEMTEQRQGYEMVCKGLMLQMLTLLIRHQAETNRTLHPKYEESLLHLAHELQTSYRKKWTNGEMAAFINVHEDYMSKLFKDMLGMSPNKYLQSVRHQQAKRLLRETDDKIERIAMEIGYDDFHYFSRVFKKWEGMSAQQYRKFSQII
ncbi:helix-turn-helix domain-containing protein [Paenibacillus sp. GCM10023248]|uniref:helix-turn-helix transcriptional regulator n=1 Tax=Bacillales TaxID=1385 RepID=UPI002377DE49|nr:MULTISPECIES: AraC family transcriptional regulator [Bacillales]MDD9267023.1 AraC family transcriptional regulator [Paenibacillus sp. MAHUQ-63]MDR6881224.1 AraC-like DNA-binding protein [Bacillus sp. 3255]